MRRSPQLSRLRLAPAGPGPGALLDSVLEVHSATVHTNFASFGTKQILWVAGGVVGMFIFAKIDYHRLIDWTPWAYGIGLLALAAVLSPLGHKALGGRRWMKLGPMLLQPSEYVKLVLILMVARYLPTWAGAASPGRRSSGPS